MKIINVVLITIPFAAVWLFYFSDFLFVPFYHGYNYWIVIALFVVVYVLCARVYDAFLVSYSETSTIVYSQMLSALIGDGILYFVMWLLIRRPPQPAAMVGVALGQMIMSTVWTGAVRAWYFSMFSPKRSAVIYDMREGLDKLIDDYGLKRKFDVVKNAFAAECVKDISMLDDVESVFISGVHSHDRNIIIKYCVAHGKQAFIIPRIGDVLMSSARPMHMFHLPVMRLVRYSPSPEYAFFKRLTDVVVSVAALVLLSPIMLITALFIRADGGPVLYRQKRLTKDGKEFYVKKFRSMRVDAERDGIARLSTGDDDDRVTSIGRFIRKVRIDELPQLLNILEGDMSLIGPRPERPEIAAQYEEEMPEFALRLQMKAGLTGYAQVYGKYNTTPYDKLQMDLMYIANPSIIEDIKILFGTVKILFLPESTEGIEKGSIIAGER